jgi:hypothetical protein
MDVVSLHEKCFRNIAVRKAFLLVMLHGMIVPTWHPEGAASSYIVHARVSGRERGKPTPRHKTTRMHEDCTRC